ncbi:hypothetical protein ACHAWU_005096 [Discostella pseudostelligera]|uniref:AFG1-like ATPase n=1 Tax=Discostella pseudostelligera TaxID=259834 RepID=A0ABD3M6B2_9STRA
MSLHRTAATLLRQRVGPISQAFKRRVASSERFRLDSEQLLLSSQLDDLYFSLTSSSLFHTRFFLPDQFLETAARHFGGSLNDNFTTNNNIDIAAIAMATAHSLFVNNNYYSQSQPRGGIYIHGSVGVGKSMMVDLFYSMCANGLSIPEEDVHFHPIQRTHKRIHFHEFMLDVHQRIHNYKMMHPKSDPIPSVAASLAKEARLLCFDEMQVTDIADAMIIKRLITILFDLGVVIVTTSNRPPSALYEGGINRSIFLPFIETIHKRMMVIRMEGTHDYRRDEILEQWFAQGTAAAGNDDNKAQSETIPVVMGRSVHVNRANAHHCGWFTFQELCNQPLGAADYLAIAHRFDCIIVEKVPQLCGNTYNEARRFVTLIDALYEARTKLVISADVSRENLFVGFDATVETHDGDEEIAIFNDDKQISSETFINGEVAVLVHFRQQC